MSLVYYSASNISKALQNQDLIAIENVNVTVTNLDGDIVLLYTDKEGSPKSNPFTADNSGMFGFYVEQGQYIVNTEKGGNTGSIQIDLSSSGGIFFNDVEEMRVLFSGSFGEIINTENYHDNLEGGGSTYITKTQLQADEDGDIYSESSKGNILLDNGMVAVLRVNSSINVKSYGAIDILTYGDNYDSTLNIQEAINTGFPVYRGKGEYQISSLSLVDNSNLFGPGVISSHGSITPSDLIVCDSISGFTISGPFKGINSAHFGIKCSNCSSFSIEKARVSNFGSPTGFYSGININDCTDYNVKNNIITEGDGTTSADISIGGQSIRGIITGNFCLSNNSEGITIQPTGEPNIIRATISNNVCSGHERHGIIGVYAEGKPVELTISNNVCSNNGWTGIYLQGQLSGSDNDSGLISCVGNVCVNNGGLDLSGSFNAGIYVAGRLGYSIIGNTIKGTSRDDDGTARGGKGSGVFMVNAENAIISGNNISDSYGNNLNFSSAIINNININNNSFIDAEDSQVFISINGSGNTAKNLSVSNNQFRADVKDPNGIYMTVSSLAGWQDFSIKENNFKGRKDNTDKSAIRMFAASSDLIKGTVEGNVVEGYDVGVIRDGGGGHLSWGRDQKVFNNSFNNCIKAIKVSSVSSAWAIIGKNNFSNNTTDVDGGSYWRYGEINAQGNAVVYDSSPPAFATWSIGDTCINNQPNIGEPYGWVYTAEGEWQQIGLSLTSNQVWTGQQTFNNATYFKNTCIPDGPTIAMGTSTNEWWRGYFGTIFSSNTINTAIAFRVAGEQVVGSRKSAIPNASSGSEASTINSVLTAMRQHGLIET